MSKKRFMGIAGAVCAALVTAAFCVFAGMSLHNRLQAVSYQDQARPVTKAAYRTETGESGELELPAKLSGLAPGSAVTVYMSAEANTGDSLLVKAVFTPIRLYMNDVLVCELGQEGDYPAYMNDPPTILTVVPFPDEGGTVRLRFEYRSPSQRSELSLPALYAGDEISLLVRQFYVDGFSFLFSFILIFVGIVLALIFTVLSGSVPSGSPFLWLGLFSIAGGIWGIGECDLTAVLLPYPSLLYAMSYVGLFTVTIPFIRFGLLMLNPRNRWPLQLTLAVHYISVAAALLLQLTGVMDFTKSLYWFHIIAPLGFVTFSVCLVWEYFRHRNAAAGRFAPAILLLASSTVLEVLNYWLGFTDRLTLFFQLGALAFVVALGVVSGQYVRESLRTAAEKSKLEYEMAAMGRQLELQRLQYRKMAENDALVKAQRHDLRHQLTVIRELGGGQAPEKLAAYIDGLIEDIPSDRERRLCENYAVNAVAAYYCSMAKSGGIGITVGLTVPEDTGCVHESDLCIIVGNLLENAVEACRRMEEGERFIRVNSRLSCGTLTIAVDNSFDGKAREEDGEFLSSKREGAGTGLSSVSAVAQKYGGAARFEAGERVFRSSVYIRLEPDAG